MNLAKLPRDIPGDLIVAGPPAFDEQTDEVLTEFGFGAAGLRQAKVV
jgi:hypothetical protein